MALSFNGVTKIITITTDVELDVRDLWSRWIDWYLTSDNSKFGIAMENVGGDDIDISAGTKIPIYLFLQNGWKIRPKEANHTLAVTNGILLTDDGSDPFTNTTGTYTIRILNQQPVQAISFSTGGGGGTISAQDIRDAMALASGDTPAEGSIDEKLNNIKIDTGLIPAAL